MHSDGSTCGFCTWIFSISGSLPSAPGLSLRFGTSSSSTQMALGDVGQNSSHTMQGVPIDQGKQRP